MCAQFPSRIRIFTTPWIVAHQALLSMEFSRQEYWNGLPFPSPRDLPDLGTESQSPTLQADALRSDPPGKPPKQSYLGTNNSKYQFSKNFFGCCQSGKWHSRISVQLLSRVQLFVTP